MRLVGFPPAFFLCVCVCQTNLRTNILLFYFLPKKKKNKKLAQIPGLFAVIYILG